MSPVSSCSGLTHTNCPPTNPGHFSMALECWRRYEARSWCQADALERVGWQRATVDFDRVWLVDSAARCCASAERRSREDLRTFGRSLVSRSRKSPMGGASRVGTGRRSAVPELCPRRTDPDQLRPTPHTMRAERRFAYRNEPSRLQARFPAAQIARELPGMALQTSIPGSNPAAPPNFPVQIRSSVRVARTHCIDPPGRLENRSGLTILVRFDRLRSTGQSIS